MPLARAAHYDFAILSPPSLDVPLISSQVRELRAEHSGRGPVSLELFGRPGSGESLLLFHFSFLAYSSALRAHMERVADRLQGRLFDPQLLPLEEKERFYEQRLKSFELRREVGEDVQSALLDFRQAMGLVARSDVPVLHVSFDSEDALCAAYRRFVMDGSIVLPTGHSFPVGAELKVLFVLPGQEPLAARATVVKPASVVERGVWVTLTPSEALEAFLAKEAQRRREGRRLSEAERRRESERYATLLEVSFRNFPELSMEFATNISRGGLFVRTDSPPPLRSLVRLAVSLPSGETVETDAEVVHVVTPEEARLAHRECGVGLSFKSSAPDFHRPIEALLADYRARKLRILVVDDDAFFRQVLSDAFTEAGMDVRSAKDGVEAMRVLVDELHQLDGMTVDLQMPGLGGFALVDRIRRLGGERDFRVMVLSGGSDEQLLAMRESGLVHDVIPKRSPLPEVVARLKKALGRGGL